MALTMCDYSFFEKMAWRPDRVSELGPWDIFLSGYNLSDRVKDTFDRVEASEKWWLVFPEYQIANDKLPPSTNLYRPETREEDIFVRGLFQTINVKECRLCIDCTGVLRPHLLFLIRYLAESGIRFVDVLYSEPEYYRAKEMTSFAGQVVDAVRSVRGYEGSPTPDAGEIMIIGAGYDPHLIAAVCLARENALKIVLIGFPPLKPEMYQESILRIAEAGESLNFERVGQHNAYFVPANDPFETANVLHDIVEREVVQHGRETNIYLCPLATKAQALGFSLFYQAELLGSAASVYFPFSRYYSPDTSHGLARVWHYNIDFEMLKEMGRLEDSI